MKLTKCSAIFCPLILFLSFHGLAQQTDHVTIPGIPFRLFWENAPINFSVVNATLTIEAGEKTDMFRDPNATYNTDNAPKLLFFPDSNFVFTTSIQHDFENKWDAGAIVLKADEQNWIKFAFEKDYKGLHRVVSVVTKDISDDCNSVAISGNEVFYKIARAGKVVTLYYAEDGKNWFLIRHLQFESSTPFKLGFLAQSPTGKHCRASFSNIQYEAKKIIDPYAGN